MGDWLQGNPINREATIGAAESFLGQWAGVLGGEYRPDVVSGASEDSVHRRARSGASRPWNWNIPHSHQAPQQQQQPPPPPDPDHAERQRVMAARRVMGFTPNEVLDHDMIKRRHRALLKRHHPDHGGSNDRMAVINSARDTLLESL
jgi:hypothetical protein